MAELDLLVTREPVGVGAPVVSHVHLEGYGQVLHEQRWPRHVSMDAQDSQKIDKRVDVRIRKLTKGLECRDILHEMVLRERIELGALLVKAVEASGADNLLVRHYRRAVGIMPDRQCFRAD